MRFRLLKFTFFHIYPLFCLWFPHIFVAFFFSTLLCVAMPLVRAPFHIHAFGKCAAPKTRKTTTTRRFLARLCTHTYIYIHRYMLCWAFRNSNLVVSSSLRIESTLCLFHRLFLLLHNDVFVIYNSPLHKHGPLIVCAFCVGGLFECGYTFTYKRASEIRKDPSSVSAFLVGPGSFEYEYISILSKFTKFCVASTRRATALSPTPPSLPPSTYLYLVLLMYTHRNMS